MDIGSELKKARIARARYIPEIAHELKVPATVIVAMEHNDFVTVGDDQRCRELVRAYAVAVGVVPEPLLTALTEAGGVLGLATSLAAQAAQAEKAASEATKGERAAASQMTTTGSRKRPWVAGAVVAMLAVGAVWAVQVGDNTSQPTASASPTVTTPSATPTASATETTTATAVPTASESTTAVPTETPTATETTSPAPTPKPTYLASRVNGLIIIRVTASTAATVRVYNASGTVFSGRLQAGDTKFLTSDTDATFTTTNAGGLSMTVSGTDYGVLGQPGQTYTHKFRIG